MITEVRDNIRFHLGDCMELMAGKPDNYWGLAVVDPPYGIGQPKQANLKDKGRASLEDRLTKNRLNTGSGKLKNRILNRSNCDWDNDVPIQEYFNVVRKRSKNQIIWGGNYFQLPPTRCVICWDKVQPWENFSQIEIAWTSFDSPAKIFKYDNRTGGKIHPTQKPIKLYRWILQNYATKGTTILDTHGGSMTNAIACDMEGYSLDICEIDEEYFESGLKAFDNYKRQLKLF